MDPIPVTAPKRRFAGDRPAAGAHEDGLAALADALLSGPTPPSPPGPLDVGVSRPACLPPAKADVPHGLYVLIPAGIEPEDRRRTALAVACRLAPHARPAALFVFQQGLADAHILGEVACGRLGPQNCLPTADTAGTIAALLRQSEQIGIVLLDHSSDIGRLGRLARRTVFIVRPDTESVVETYREMKSWRQQGAGGEAALFIIGGDGPEETGRLQRRLGRASREFLGLDVSVQGFMEAGAVATTSDHAEPLRILAQAPAEEVWPYLLPAVRSGREAIATQPSVSAAPPAPSLGAVAAPPSDPSPVFSLWAPPDRRAILKIIESQVPSQVAGSLRQIFRVDVDEPDAPPLAAVRQDGALVAILLAAADAPPPDTRASEAWLVRHRTLLARAYPEVGIADDVAPTAVVLTPLKLPPATEGIRRFLPLAMGRQHGVVFLP